MKEIARVDMNERDFNCAESTLDAANEGLDLGMGDAELKMIGGFGGGMGCGSVCGALTGSIAAISKIMVKERAHITPGLMETCKEYRELFEKEFGAVDCSVLRPRGECGKIITRNAEMLEEFAKKLMEKE